MKKFIIIITIFIVSLVSLFQIIPKVNNVNKYILTYSNGTLDNIDTNLINNNNLNGLFNKSYYENKDQSIFSSAAISNPEPSIYQLYWVTDILKKIDTKDIDLNKIKRVAIDIDKSPDKSNYEELDYLRMIITIYKRLNLEEHFSKNDVVNLLMKHYSKKENLFFLKTENESISDKLSATQMAIDAANNMDIHLDIIDDLKNRLINLYKQDEYFTEINFSTSINNNGGAIICTLYNLGITADNIKEKLPERTKWNKYWQDKLYNSTSNDLLSLILIQNMYNIGDFLREPLNIKSDYLDNMFEKKDFFERSELNVGSFIVEPQYIGLQLNLCLRNKYQYPFNIEIKNYINDCLKSNFIKSSDIRISLQDNFYGIKLANKFNFLYDKKKMYNQVYSQYTSYIEDSSITDNEKLNYVYFLLLNCKELNIDITSKKLILKRITSYLNSINFSDYDKISDNLYSIHTCLEIITMINGKLEHNLDTKLINYINDIESKDTILTLNSIYHTSLIMKYIGVEKFDVSTLSKLKNNLNKFGEHGCYKAKTSDGEPDIISTYMGFKIKDILSIITDDDKTKIKDFLINLKSDKDIFKVSKSSVSNSNLRIIYFVALTSDFYGK